MKGAELELQKRSKHLNSLIQKKKAEEQQLRNVRLCAADMPTHLQNRAFRCAREMLDSMEKLDSKRLALAIKREFDSSCGPAWHCIVGTNFGSYVTHTTGGFLYFSIEKYVFKLKHFQNIHVFMYQVSDEEIAFSSMNEFSDKFW